jgi:hyperpolarization activated cyclic nucleotide-gated potassium channel 2
MIRHRYLQSGFTIDLLSTLPLDRIGATFTDNTSALRSLKMLRILRLARLMKLIAMLKNQALFDSIEDWLERMRIDTSSFSLLGLFALLFFCAHLLGCCWYYVSTFELKSCPAEDTDDGECNSWIRSYFGTPLPDVSTRYVTTVYWALATMTTVGYGDVSATAKSEREMVAAVLSMLIGTTM